jgi:hypothetical protein
MIYPFIAGEIGTIIPVIKTGVTSMSASLENRIATLEQQVARLQKRQNMSVPAGQEWLADLYGKFAADPIFDRAMKLGRKYRKSLRPRVKKGKSKR